MFNCSLYLRVSCILISWNKIHWVSCILISQNKIHLVLEYEEILVSDCLFGSDNWCGESFDFQEEELETEERLWDLYERWRSHHTESRNIEDKHKRFKAFKANARYVNSFNKKDKPYKLKLNQFADMTSHEFSSIYTCSSVQHHQMLQGNETFMYEDVKKVPHSVDWKKKGAVTVSKINSNAIRYHDLSFCDVKSPAVRIDWHEEVPANDEDDLLKAGVFKGECGRKLNHVVTIVGYGTTVDGTKYWLVKNSWGLTGEREATPRPSVLMSCESQMKLNLSVLSIIAVS
ncbi:hypothetical protein Pfo_015294 [Paulownia fortunei]|nr:hypothetical protein Pfo_015294 [Paulownia fortunei]